MSREDYEIVSKVVLKRYRNLAESVRALLERCSDPMGHNFEYHPDKFPVHQTYFKSTEILDALKGSLCEFDGK